MPPRPVPQPVKIPPEEKYKDLNTILDKLPTEVAVAQAYRIDNDPSVQEGNHEAWEDAVTNFGTTFTDPERESMYHAWRLSLYQTATKGIVVVASVILLFYTVRDLREYADRPTLKNQMIMLRVISSLVIALIGAVFLRHLKVRPAMNPYWYKLVVAGLTGMSIVLARIIPLEVDVTGLMLFGVAAGTLAYVPVVTCVVIIVTLGTVQTVSLIILVPEKQDQVIAGFLLVLFLLFVNLKAYLRMEKVARQNFLAIEQVSAEQRKLAFEQQKTDGLLLNILPRFVISRMKTQHRVVSESYRATTVLFADLVGFTVLSQHVTPKNLVKLLNRMFTDFDDLAEIYGLMKIKTIGDCFMCVGGIPKEDPRHAGIVAEMALDMLHVMKALSREFGVHLDVRIGMNSGPVIAGVIGLSKYCYDIWGDAVNVASRMESSGVPDHIQITETTYNLLRKDYQCAYRGKAHIHGKGMMKTWFLEGRRATTSKAFTKAGKILLPAGFLEYRDLQEVGSRLSTMQALNNAPEDSDSDESVEKDVDVVRRARTYMHANPLSESLLSVESAEESLDSDRESVELDPEGQVIKLGDVRRFLQRQKQNVDRTLGASRSSSYAVLTKTKPTTAGDGDDVESGKKDAGLLGMSRDAHILEMVSEYIHNKHQNKRNSTRDSMMQSLTSSQTIGDTNPNNSSLRPGGHNLGASTASNGTGPRSLNSSASHPPRSTGTPSSASVMKKYTLTFLNQDLEEMYLADRAEKSAAKASSFAIMALVMAISFGAVDIMLTGVNAFTMMFFVRYGILIPISGCLKFSPRVPAVQPFFQLRGYFAVLALAIVEVFVTQSQSEVMIVFLTSKIIIVQIVASYYAYLHVRAMLATQLTLVAIVLGSVVVLFRGSLNLSASLLPPAGCALITVLATALSERKSRMSFLLLQIAMSRKEDAHDERAKSSGLLYNILPAKVANFIQYGPSSGSDDNECLAEHFPCVSIMFADLVDFTKMSSASSASEVVDILNKLFSEIDQVTSEMHVEKIKTIGDAYMAAAGVPAFIPDHAHRLARLALKTMRMGQATTGTNGLPMTFRIGLHCGPVVGGVIGVSRFAYDVWGDTVNTAARMESHSLAGRIQITRDFYEKVKDQFVTELRGEIDVKGKGSMLTYWLLGEKGGPLLEDVPVEPTPETDRRDPVASLSAGSSPLVPRKSSSKQLPSAAGIPAEASGMVRTPGELSMRSSPKTSNKQSARSGADLIISGDKDDSSSLHQQPALKPVTVPGAMNESLTTLDELVM